ncbi:N-6 DNA methylase [Ornithinimicrobium pratense]|uniref:site-specific DNA-methyltransferase (adenine-specific) n=1 Tax=Ornithinimicrobium pratense TaxID=2593973 RepID=A0A5J6V7X9_9MICO|nr:N-6 DNA methylase [Ornithinimicrobium pratense]QFG69241.1 N-6 DNA methylase [Ornithinimicrobium pratense]
MSQLANFVWSIADQLRGVYKPNQYGNVVLPMTILRRMECVLAPHRDTIQKLAGMAQGETLELLVRDRTGLSFYNTSPYTLAKILEEPENLRNNLRAYLDAFSGNVADLFGNYKFDQEIDTLDTNDRLYLVLDRFAKIDLGPEALTNAQMGTMFEDLIRRFAAASNETAGEHFTPRDAVRLLVDLLVEPDGDVLTGSAVRTVYDPTAGTGGMLSVLDERLTEMNPKAQVVMYGQELNAQSYAICKSELIGKGQDANNIALGDTLANDHHLERTFDYVLSNPPYGGDWKASQSAVLSEAENMAGGGRFPGGLPAISDGQMLFLQVVSSKLRPASEGGGRAGIVLNGSPLFTGGAESGPSNIRRWLLESDLVDVIVALPTDMFYNTGISTFMWVLDNAKSEERRGKVQLIDGREFFTRLRRSLGSKGKEIEDRSRERLLRIYAAFDEQAEEDAPYSKVLAPEDFGYREITVEQPLRRRFEITDETLSKMTSVKQIQKLSEENRAKLSAGLETLRGRVWMDRQEFLSALRMASKAAGYALPTPMVKVLWQSIGVHDDEAVICTDRGGNWEPDPASRSTEIVPFERDIEKYFRTEVQPHAPDAWVDHSKTKVGYEIPFTRLFYSGRRLRGAGVVSDEAADVMAQIQSHQRTLEEIPGSKLRETFAASFDAPLAPNWRRVRLGSILKERREVGSEDDFPALSVTLDGVIPQLSHVAKTADRDARRIVRAGDIVINSRSDRRGSSGLAIRDGSVSIIYTVLRPVGIHPRYAHHLIRSIPFQEEFYRWGHGIVADLWTTRYSEMARILVPLPPPEEQAEIVRQLDALDELSRLAARYAALVSEQVRALSAELVNHGTGEVSP